jgi:tetratricopeptide (TPR) repeat protein
MASPGPEQLQRIVGSKNVQIAHVRHSTITVSIDGGPHRAVPLEPAWIELPQAVTSPARLLRARYGIVPYLPPGDLAEQLNSWAHGSEPFALRVIAGTAGAGKTRIAIELCRSLAELGWVTGLLKAKLDLEQLDLLAHARTARLVVIDYAETRVEQLADVLPILATQASREHPMRVLLTIRSRAASVDDVRRVLYGRDDALDVVTDDATVDLLSKLPFGVDERARLATIAVEAISRRLGREAAPDMVPDGGDHALTTALMVLIASYLAVVDGEVPTTRSELLDGLLRHEDRYWSKTAASAGLSVDEALRRRVVAFATLAGTGTSEFEAQATQLLRLVPDLAETIEERRRALARWAHELYPGAAWWNSVEPDLIGEHLVATTYGDQPDVLGCVLAGRPSTALAQPLRVLAGAARDHPMLADTLGGVVNDHLMELCQAAVEQASGTDAMHLLQMGTTVAAGLDHLLALVPPDPSRVPDALEIFPRQNAALALLRLTLTAQLADHRRRLASASPKAFVPILAATLSDLGSCLDEVGRLADALECAEEAVTLLRHLVRSEGAAFTPRLALALSHLGVLLAEAGQHERALWASEEAVRLCRGLSSPHPTVIELQLAGALTNLGKVRWQLGRRPAALQAAQEAVEIRRHYASLDPAWSPELALALNNLSIDLSSLGRPNEALQANEEAVMLYRSLASSNPLSFEPDLALALHNLGYRLGEVDRHEEALRAAEDAVDIYRRLAAANPGAFERHLADALDGLGTHLATLERYEHAVRAAREAVSLYRRLPFSASRPRLARALTNLGHHLAKLGHTEPALQATQEAVEIHRRLAPSMPAAFLPDLAYSLLIFASVRAEVRVCLIEALAAAEEAADIYRRLADNLPDAYTRGLHAALETAADIQRV